MSRYHKILNKLISIIIIKLETILKLDLKRKKKIEIIEYFKFYKIKAQFCELFN